MKNAPGDPVDSPDSARRIVSELHRGWLRAAGATLGGAPDGIVEVSPLVSYGGEGLAALVAGVTLEAPALLAAATEPLPGVEWGGEHVLRHGMRGCVRARRQCDARARVRDSHLAGPCMCMRHVPSAWV